MKSIRDKIKSVRWKSTIEETLFSIDSTIDDLWESLVKTMDFELDIRRKIKDHETDKNRY
jgi:hypothetical protein